MAKRESDVSSWAYRWTRRILLRPQLRVSREQAAEIVTREESKVGNDPTQLSYDPVERLAQWEVVVRSAYLVGPPYARYWIDGQTGEVVRHDVYPM